VLPRRHVPNALTIARVVLAAGFFVILAIWNVNDPRPASPTTASPDVTLLVAAIIFTLAALTDALDGLLARRWNVVSVFGRVMDPFADKVLILGAFILLAGPGFAQIVIPALGSPGNDPATHGIHPHPRQVSYVLPWMAVVILARELLITSLRAAFESRGIDFSAGPSGKFKMILQSICVPVVLLAVALRPGAPGAPAPLLDVVAKWLVWATVAVTAWSAIPYIARALAVSRPKPPAPGPSAFTP
jgi:CDP-diacylglycerol--glycerol-3-phosphate 3-phosphatidyltransferase